MIHHCNLYLLICGVPLLFGHLVVIGIISALLMAYSTFTWIYLLRNNSDALPTFVNFKTQVELQLHSKIKCIQNDWGGEYRAFSDYLASHGILHKTSCPHTQAQNGVAERKHRHIVEHVRTFLAKSSLPFEILG